MKSFAVGICLGLVVGIALLAGRLRTLVHEDQTDHCERQIALLQRQAKDVQEDFVAKLFFWLLPKAPDFGVSSGDPPEKGFVDFIPVAGRLWRAREAQLRCEQRLQKAQQEFDLFLTRLEALRLRFPGLSFLGTGAGKLCIKISRFCCVALLLRLGWRLLSDLGIGINGAANTEENGAILEPDDEAEDDGSDEEKENVPQKEEQEEEGARLDSDKATNIQKPLVEGSETDDGVTEEKEEEEEEEDNSATSSDSSQTSGILAGNRFKPLAKLEGESNELRLPARRTQEVKAKKQTRRSVEGKRKKKTKQLEAELETAETSHVEQWANVSRPVWVNLLFLKRQILSTYGVTLWRRENGKMLLTGTRADVDRFIKYGMKEFVAYEKTFVRDVHVDCFGRIIGKGGINLSRFEEEYGVYVRIKREDIDEEGRATVMLIGSEEGVAEVKARIMEIVEDEEKRRRERAAASLHVKHLRVAREHFGRIIGRNGANRNNLLEGKNADVKFDDDANVVTVKASSLEELEEIERGIWKAVQLGELKKQPWHQFQLSLDDRSSIIKNNNLRELQDSLGVTISFPRRDDPWEVVSIQGERAKAEEVYQKLTSCLKEEESSLTKDIVV